MKIIKKTNYVVTTQEWQNGLSAEPIAGGVKVLPARTFVENEFECETDYEVRTILGKGKFNRMYQVTSPVGLPVHQFGPF